MVIAEGIVLLLFKTSGSPVFDPFPVTDLIKMTLAENVSSSCAIEVTPEIEEKIGRSHLVLESSSMGLLMRFVLERVDQYKIELDFADSV